MGMVLINPLRPVLMLPDGNLVKDGWLRMVIPVVAYYLLLFFNDLISLSCARGGGVIFLS